MTPDREALIHAIKLRENIAKRDHHGFVDLPYEMVGNVLAMLKEQKVVRCKDCIYMEKMDVDIREGDLIWCSIHEFGREIDYYCADGEKRE